MKKIFPARMVCLLLLVVLCLFNAACAESWGVFELNGASYNFIVSELRPADPDAPYPNITLEKNITAFYDVAFDGGDPDRIAFRALLKRDDGTNVVNKVNFVVEFDECATMASGTADVGEWRVPGTNTMFRYYVADYTVYRSVSAAHSLGEWKSNGDATHSRVCEKGCGYTDNRQCVFRQDPETQKMICTSCKWEYVSDPIPETGDNANIALWAFLLALSAAGILVIGRRAEKEY